MSGVTSASKVIMAQKLQSVQVKLMKEEITDSSLSYILPLIYQKCHEENLTFWFNFLEDACVLNLRDVSHQNNELNIRYAYPSIPLDMKHLNYFKEMVLMNTFLLTTAPVQFHKKSEDSSAKQESYKPIKESNLVPPTSIRTVIDMLEKTGEPVTKKSIEKYLQMDKMSTDNRRKCIAYLKSMEE